MLGTGGVTYCCGHLQYVVEAFAIYMVWNHVVVKLIQCAMSTVFQETGEKVWPQNQMI